MRISSFVRKYNAPAELVRFCTILHIAKERGAIVVEDTRGKGCTMRECVDWLAVNLEVLGIRVERVPYKKVWERIGRSLACEKVVFWYGNLWAMVADRQRAKRRKVLPWVVLQTEHKGHRVYEKPKCHYKWFLRLCDQVWDFGFDFCKGTHSLYLPHMWTLRSPMEAPPTKAYDVCLLGKESPDRKSLIREVKRSPVLKPYFGDNLTPKESQKILSQSKVGLMIPRQEGNLEIHRFASLVNSFMVILCPPLPPRLPRTKDIEELFGPAIDFVPLGEMPRRIEAYQKDQRVWLARCIEGIRWYENQDLRTLLLQVKVLCRDLISVKESAAFDDRREPKLEGEQNYNPKPKSRSTLIKRLMK